MPIKAHASLWVSVAKQTATDLWYWWNSFADCWLSGRRDSRADKVINLRSNQPYLDEFPVLLTANDTRLINSQSPM